MIWMLRTGVACSALVVTLSGGIGRASTSDALLADPNQYVRLPSRIDWHRVTSPEIDILQERVERALKREYGGEWRVFSWDPHARTPRFIYGTGVDLGVALSDDFAVEAVSRQVIASLPEVFGAATSNLRLARIRRAPRKVSIRFQQMSQGLEVFGGGAHLTFTEDGRLFELGSKVFPVDGLTATPVVPAQQAPELARRDLPCNRRSDVVLGSPELVIFPVRQSETRIHYHLAWHVRFRTRDPLGLWDTYVDAHNGELLRRDNEIGLAVYEGVVLGFHEPVSWCEGIRSCERDSSLEAEPCPFPYVRVRIDPDGPITYTDQDGRWTIADDGLTGPQVVVADFNAAYVNIHNCDGEEDCRELNARATGVANPAEELTLVFRDGQAEDNRSRMSERDVLMLIGNVHDFYQGIDPDFWRTNEPIDAYVDDPTAASRCGAVAGVNFMKFAGEATSTSCDGPCAEFSRIASLVYHEYGHSIHLSLIYGRTEWPGVREGNADFVSNLLTQSPLIAESVCLDHACETSGWSSLNFLRYPEDLWPPSVPGSTHHNGQVIAGFYWDAWQSMRGTRSDEEARITMARIWHFGVVLLEPTDYLTQVMSAFVADDDDGNILNGTPNYGHLAVGAMNHGLDYPEITEGVVIQHDPPASIAGDADVAITAVITSTEGAVDPSAVRVFYRVGEGVLEAVVMTADGEPDSYTGVLRDLRAPAEVTYYIEASDEMGNSRTVPPNAPAILHDFDVATFLDPMEYDLGWIVNADGIDDASSGIWVRVDPSGTIAQPEDDHTPFEGRICWVTGNAASGLPDDVADVDGGTTRLYSPVYGLQGASSVKVKYQAWFSNNRGEAPDEDHWVVEVRNDGGPWVALESRPESWSSWRLHSFLLDSLFSDPFGDVQLRFAVSDLGSESLVEGALDDFVVLAVNGVTETDESEQMGMIPAGDYLNLPAPNPFTPNTSFRYGLAVDSSVSLDIYDVQGRLVRALAAGESTRGHHVIVWDGKDVGGRVVAFGVYYVRLRTDAQVIVRKLAVLD